MTGPEVDQRAPLSARRSVTEVLAGLTAAPRLLPFDELLIDYCAEFARRLGRGARGYAELQALAFWMRRSELVRLRDEFAKLATDRTTLMPRGLVFHVPPANVDTIFIYSWLLSLLCGNTNVVRLSSRSTEQTELILGIVASLGEEERFAPVSAGIALVAYGHDDEVTGGLSAAADLRVIWGGDATVAAIRRSPLAPHATELTFPDRVSLAAFAVDAVDALDDEAVGELARRFYNDAYWFNQLGCSSPRMVVWVGGQEVARRTSRRFFSAVHDITVAKGLIVEPGTAIAKLTHGYGAAITASARAVVALGNQVLVVEDVVPREVSEDFVGAGTFHSMNVDALQDIAPMVTRRFQTVSQYGFTSDELEGLVHELRGRGVDRIVPVGEALTFNRYWDGNDLLQSFTRRVYVDASSPTTPDA